MPRPADCRFLLSANFHLSDSNRPSLESIYYSKSLSDVSTGETTYFEKKPLAERGRGRQGLIVGVCSELFPPSQLPTGHAQAEGAEEDGAGGGSIRQFRHTNIYSAIKARYLQPDVPCRARAETPRRKHVA